MKKTFSIIVGIIAGLAVSFAIGYALKSVSSSASSTSATKTFGGIGNRNGAFGAGRNRFGSGMSGMQYSGARMGSGFLGGMGRNGTGNFMRGSGSRTGIGRGVSTGSTSDPQQLLDQSILQK